MSSTVAAILSPPELLIAAIKCVLVFASFATKLQHAHQHTLHERVHCVLLDDESLLSFVAVSAQLVRFLRWLRGCAVQCSALLLSLLRPSARMMNKIAAAIGGVGGGGHTHKQKQRGKQRKQRPTGQPPTDSR